MEDDKKNAVTDEVVENVQQEAELTNEDNKIDPTEGSDEETQEQLINIPDEEERPDETAPVEEATVEKSPDLSIDSTEEVVNNQNYQKDASVLAVVETDDSEEDSTTEKEIDANIEELTKENIIENGMSEDAPSKVEDSEVEDTIEEPTVLQEDVASEEESVIEELPAKETAETIVQEEHHGDVSEADTKNAESTEQPTSDENQFESVDLVSLSKSEQLDLLKKMLGEENIRRIDALFKELGAHFDTNFDTEKKVALEAFLKIEGNDEADFEFKGDDIDQEFHSLYEKLRKRRSQYFQELGKEKDNNLIKKNEILILLREIIDGEDQESFNKVKKLQEEWKAVGQVPGSQNQSLWASYHALMDRFYDHRSIYFELKELDRKKNLDAKLELCKKAEVLDASTNLKHAISQLNELHEEFKHIGPVPREDQEALWQRFKAASDLVYEKRNDFNEHQKVEFQANLETKLGLVEKAKALTEFESDRIKHWNSKTKELQELQKQWESVGGMPRQSAKEVNKAFWGNYKKFFANKSKFFKWLDSQRDENLEKKKGLIAKALDMRESKDWEATANAMKKLQTEWKEIGIVPDKYRKSLYEEFNGHCNYFFEQKRGQNAEQNKEFEQNLERKKSILTDLQTMTNGGAFDLDKVFNLLDDYSSAGLVPRNAVGKTLDRYDKICGQLMNNESLSEFEVDELKAHIQVSKLRNSPHGDRKINRKEGILKRKISGMESDIYNWKRNIDFFGRSANAEHMKNEFQVRIDEAEKELARMKQELRLLSY